MKKCVKRYSAAFWLGVFIWTIFFGSEAFGETFKGKTFQIDIPDNYKMTVYKQPSNMAFFASLPDGASVSVIVQKNPFLGKDPDPTGEKRLEMGALMTQTLKNRIWDYYSRQNLVEISKGEMKINGDKTLYYFQWSYLARDPREERMDLTTYQYIEGEYLYTMTLASWHSSFDKHKEELGEIAKSLRFVETPEDELTPPTKPTKKEENEE